MLFNRHLIKEQFNNKKTMKKIDITPYTVFLTNTLDGSRVEKDYGIKESIIEMLYNPALKLTAIDMLKQEDLARKIMNSSNELILSDEEYAKIDTALKLVAGFNKNDLTLIHRIVEAETLTDNTTPQ